MRVIILGLLFTSACASPQYTKTAGVKGGSGRRYYFGENMVKNNYTNTYGAQNSLSSFSNNEVGVCYIEVPTASLVRDPAHVPTGNGSRSDLSRIRSCCKGYIRNIYNFRICDPVCTNECVNGVCSAPDTCTCFPDHVRNLAGFCIPTCPIGCQNGYCSGGECLCKDGYRLDSQGRFCVPVCRENCGGIGNCTSPNTCECRNGYTTSPEGNCKPVCDRCRDGECIQPNVCRCRPGYTKNQNGDCISTCTDGNKCSNPSRDNTQSLYPHPDPNANTDRPNRERLTTPHPLYPNQPSNRQNSSQYNPHQQYPQQYPQPPYGNQYPNQYNLNQHNQGQHNPNQQYPNQQFPNQQGYGQQPNYPYQQPNNPDGQQTYYPIYNNYPGNQPNQGNQHYYPNQPARPYNPNQDSTRPSDNPNQFYRSSYNRPSNYPDSQYSNQNQTNGNPQGQPIYSNYPQYPSYHNQPAYQEIQPTYQEVIPLNHNKLSNVELLCSTPCINGTCVGQDRCSCFEGYIPDVNDSSGTRCQPYCPGCSNGVCTSPYVCSCNPGYYMDHGVKGRAKCTKRIRREIEQKPVNVAELLEFLIPDY